MQYKEAGKKLQSSANMSGVYRSRDMKKVEHVLCGTYTHGDNKIELKEYRCTSLPHRASDLETPHAKIRTIAETLKTNTNYN